jgi:hypothetical protein
MRDDRGAIRLITTIFELERSEPAWLRKLVQDGCCPSAARPDHDEFECAIGKMLGS